MKGNIYEYIVVLMKIAIPYISEIESGIIQEILTEYTVLHR